MRVLLDTNVLIWWLDDHPRVQPFVELIQEPANSILFSPISVAEISIKMSLGKLTVPPIYVKSLRDGGLTELPFTSSHAQALESLPWHHKDPFDRMIIAQALTEGVPVATADHIFGTYGVQVIGRSKAATGV